MSTTQQRPPKNVLCANIGTAARQAREAMKLTQEDVSELLGVTSEFYARIERGHGLPSVRTLSKMSHLLRVEADVLLGLKKPSRLPPDEDEMDLDLEFQDAELRRVIRRIRRAKPETLKVVEKLLRELDKFGKRPSP